MRSIGILSLLVLSLTACASHSVVVAEERTGWKIYESCYDSGYYAFFDHFEVAIGFQSLNLLTWIFVGEGDLNIEFLDPNPEIQITYRPGGETFKFRPEFRLKEFLNPGDPVFKIPQGMTTQYDYKSEKFVYGKETHPFFGPSKFDVRGELNEPRWRSRIEHGPKIVTTTDPGYRRESVEYLLSVAEPSGATGAEVIFPSVRINGKFMVPHEFTFRRTEKLRQFNTRSSCSSLLPPALRNPETKERFF